MKYSLVHIGPENWFNYKADALFGILQVFQLLGKDIDFRNNQLAGDRINIIAGSDFLVGSNPTNFLKKQNIDYILIEGEFIKNRTINNRANFNFELYLDYLANAKAIITPFQHNIAALGKLGFTAQYYRWGDFPGRVTFSQKPNWQHLLGFYGLLKGARQRKIQELERNKIYPFVVNEKKPFKYRDLCLQQCFGQLSLSANLEEFVNPIRIFEAVGNGIPVFHNHQYDLDGYSEIATRITNKETYDAEYFLDIAPSKKTLTEYASSNQLYDGMKGLMI